MMSSQHVQMEEDGESHMLYGGRGEENQGLPQSRSQSQDPLRASQASDTMNSTGGRQKVNSNNFKQRVAEVGKKLTQTGALEKSAAGTLIT